MGDEGQNMENTARTDLLEKILEELHHLREGVSSLRSEVSCLRTEFTDLDERMQYVPSYLEVTMATQKEHGEHLEQLRRRIHLLIGCDSSAPPPAPTPTPSPVGGAI